jgi:hypothetical protein
VKGSETQAAELQRFNNVLAIIFLTLAVLASALQLTVVGVFFLLCCLQRLLLLFVDIVLDARYIINISNI